jgi:hypothetical protein
MTKRTKSQHGARMAPGVQQRLVTAKEDLAFAERELRSTLEALPVALRADKRMVSAALRLALDKLTAAKNELEAVLGG